MQTAQGMGHQRMSSTSASTATDRNCQSLIWLLAHPFLFVCFKILFIYLFLERGKEGEKHQCMVAFHVPPTGDLAATQARALTGNRTGDPLVHRPALNPLSHTSQDG